MNNANQLDQLVSELDQRLDAVFAASQSPGAVANGAQPATVAPLSASSERPDAIDRVLASPPRRTALKPLSDNEDINRFRQELLDGVIRADTVGKVLDLLTSAVAFLVRVG